MGRGGRQAPAHAEWEFTTIPEAERIVAEHHAAQNPLNDLFGAWADKVEGARMSIYELHKRLNKFLTATYTVARIRNYLKSGSFQTEGNTIIGWKWKDDVTYA